MEKDKEIIDILLVDDDEDYFILADWQLSEIPYTNYNLEWADTYEKAIRMIGEKRFHAYIFDYDLGKRTGIDLLKEAVKIDSKTPIIMLTGKGDLDIDNTAMKAGAIDYLNKRHLKPELLERTIRYAIQNKRLLNERNILLQEVNHRVKNNLQLISSIMQLEATTIKNESAKKVLEDCRHRLNTISILHEKLYLSENLTEVDAAEYIEDVVEDLFKSLMPPNKKIEYRLDTQKIMINTKQLIHCGIIVNELVSNALKYAFPQKYRGKPVVTVSLALEEDNTVYIGISDNGIGMPKELDIRQTDSLGLKLVAILAEEQLQGQMIVNRERGAAFHIRFKRENPQ